MTSHYYRCPFCGHDQTITGDRMLEEKSWLEIDNVDGEHQLTFGFRVCANEECRKFRLDAALEKGMIANTEVGRRFQRTRLVRHWQLIPPSSAISFPAYVPEAIRQDYEEACLIRDQSPKASATLARRCLQGMIRNFWGVKPGKLVDEIESIRNEVDSDVWSAIDAVRKVGNIGAHMEKDVNLIIDVEPGEAHKLIALIEMLVKEWYIARNERKKRLAEVTQVAEEKENAKKRSVLAMDEGSGN